MDGLSPPLLLAGHVEPAWIDYNGHMTESRYLAVFSEASDVLVARFGAGPDYAAGGCSLFTAETHLIHRHELRLGAAFRVVGRVLGADAKRVHIWQELLRDSDGASAATCEQMLLHVAVAEGRVRPMPAAMQARLAALLAADTALPCPAAAGRALLRLPGAKLPGAKLPGA